MMGARGFREMTIELDGGCRKVFCLRVQFLDLELGWQWLLQLRRTKLV